MNALLRDSRIRSLGAALAGLLAYGGWAWLANRMHGPDAALLAACTQGSYSFTITLLLNGVMEVLHGPRLRIGANTVFAATCLLLYASSWTVNAIVGTPEILLTVLPGWCLSTLYTWGYTRVLRAADRLAVNQPEAGGRRIDAQAAADSTQSASRSNSARISS